MIRTCQAVAAALALATPIHVDAAPGPANPAPVDLNDIVLPPESARHNVLGMDAYRSEDYEAAYRELKLAYEGLDVGADIDGRDMVLASLRTSLVRLYEKTGEVRHLCLARTELLRHLESLLLAFGEDTDLEDIPGIKRRLRLARADGDRRAGRSPRHPRQGREARHPSRARAHGRIPHPHHPLLIRNPYAAPHPEPPRRSRPRRPHGVPPSAQRGVAVRDEVPVGIAREGPEFVAELVIPATVRRPVGAAPQAVPLHDHHVQIV